MIILIDTVLVRITVYIFLKCTWIMWEFPQKIVGVEWEREMKLLYHGNPGIGITHIETVSLVKGSSSQFILNLKYSEKVFRVVE